MKRLKQIRQICYMNSNCGMSAEEYHILDKYTDLLCDAWKQWPDETTREFWEGDKKPEDPTESFRKDYYINFEFEELLFA